MRHSERYRKWASVVIIACMLGGIVWQAAVLRRSRTAQADARSMLDLAQRGSQSGMWCWTPSDPTKTLTEQPDSYVWYGFLFKSMLGYSDNTFPPRLDSFLNIVHPDDLQVVDAAVQEVLRGRGRVPFLTEYRLRHADGTYHWYAAKGAANLSGDDIYQMAGSITPLGTAKVERQLMYALFDAAPIALVVCDDERRIIVFNAAAERLSGYARRDAIGKPAEDLLIVDEAARKSHIAAYTKTAKELLVNPVAGTMVNSHVGGQMKKADGSALAVNVSLHSVAYGDRLAFLAYINEAK